MVPAALMQVLVAIGQQATLHTTGNSTGPYYCSEQCPELTASCSPQIKNKGPAPAMIYQFGIKHIKHGFVTICGAGPKYCGN